VILIHCFSLIGILFGIIVMWTPRIFSSEKESIPGRQEICVHSADPLRPGPGD